MMKYFLCIALILFLIGCKQEKNNKRNLPPYFSPVELNFPVEFTNGNITTSNGINFSNNGNILYISKPIAKKFKNGKTFMGIFQHNFSKGKWSKSKIMEFGNEIDAYHPVLSIDNETLFFNSRSKPESINVSIPHNIWFSKKTSKGWSKPKMLEDINSSNYDSYPSIAKNNNLYFNSDRKGGKGGMDIYVSYFVNGKYEMPINIESINSIHSENDLVIDPNENFIIFNRYFNGTTELDLYISFKKENNWSEPKKLDKINSKDKWELTPTLSPDRKYFFYELDNKIMQIDLKELTN